MIKIIARAFLFLFLVSSCADASVNKELKDLRSENAALKKRLNSYDNALIITKDNMHKYVGSLCYGPLEAKKNEVVEVRCGLYLHHLPFQVECKMDQENQSVKNSDQISRSIQNSYPGSGERLISGMYTVTFPNGEKWSMPWEKQIKVE
ncbi:hypothetical protein [Fluviicola taffensis]|uniref:hypothetical protein n=1 Tax=Fluviicola taffensis TaxID=191579 RepID=UPI0031384124